MSGWDLLLVAMPIVPAVLVLANEWVRNRGCGRGVSRASQGWLIAAIAVLALVRVGPPGAAVGLAGATDRGVLRFDGSPDAIVRLFLFAAWLGMGVRFFVAIRGPDQPGTTPGRPRTATLHSRAGSTLVSREAWAVVFSIWFWGVATATAGLAYLRWDAAPGSVTMGLALSMSSLVLAAFAPAAVRALESEPEPMDPFASPRLAGEYAVHRQAKCAGYYWLVLAVVTWIGCTVTASVLTWVVCRPRQTGELT